MPDNTYIVPEKSVKITGRLSDLIEYAVNDVFNTFLSKAKIKFDSVSDCQDFCALMNKAINMIDIENIKIKDDNDKPFNN